MQVVQWRRRENKYCARLFSCVLRAASLPQDPAFGNMPKVARSSEPDWHLRALPNF
jgi:hypothetical protein